VRRRLPDLVRGAAAPDGAELDHAPVSLAARAGQLVPGEWGEDDARADRVDPGASFAPANGFGHHAERVSALGELVGVQPVCDLVGLEHGELQQLVGGGGRERAVLVGGEGAEPVAGLGGNHHAGAAVCDDVSELLEHERGSVQVDCEDRRRGGLAR
jgi:hypothetical protein